MNFFSLFIFWETFQISSGQKSWCQVGTLDVYTSDSVHLPGMVDNQLVNVKKLCVIMTTFNVICNR